MPNWCENYLAVTGDKKTLNKMVEFVKTESREFDFNKLIPYPVEFAEADDNSEDYKGFNNGGHEWCIYNWGTKWNATEVTFEESEDMAEYYFDTAWSDCNPVILKLAGMFPDLRFEYHYQEGGCDFSGYNIYLGGVLDFSENGTYDQFRL